MPEQPFGRYRLQGLLGRGGMGQVFRAYDTATDRVVALKVLPPELAQDAMFQQRFRREAHTVARFSAPHVVPIHSYGEIDGRLYVDMQLIEGRDLGSVLAEGGAMDPARVVRIIEQAADALDSAHETGLVHRDVKPSNILLARRDFVYLIDFGIARQLDATRLTSTGAAIGTLAYMAPERFDSGTAEPSSDIYALGCVLHECLTGQQPFPGTTAQQQIAGHLTKPPPRPSVIEARVPPAFDEVVARGMAKQPGERFQTTIELADAARAALAGKPSPAPPTPREEAPTQVVPRPAAPVRPAAPPQPRTPLSDAQSLSGQRQRTGEAKTGRDSSTRLAGVLIIVAGLMAGALSAYAFHGRWDDPWIPTPYGYYYDANSYLAESAIAVPVLLTCIAFSVGFALAGRSFLVRQGRKAPAIISWLLSLVFVVFGISSFVFVVHHLDAALLVFLLLTAVGATAAWAREARYSLLAAAAGFFGALAIIALLFGAYSALSVLLIGWLWIPLIIAFGALLYRSAAKSTAS